jgi:hypothetical protein
MPWGSVAYPFQHLVSHSPLYLGGLECRRLESGKSVHFSPRNSESLDTARTQKGPRVGPEAGPQTYFFLSGLIRWEDEAWEVLSAAVSTLPAVRRNERWSSYS